MNLDSYTKLDNPAWHSLNETHQHLTMGSDEIKFYLPDVCPFGAMISPEADLSSFAKKYFAVTDTFFVVGEKPRKTNGLLAENKLVCLQMTCSEPIEIELTEDIIFLNENYKSELIDLVNSVQPGYFKEGTIRMGDYFGIFKNNKLVAVTGERMKMYEFSEISAVVTHPDYTGTGYARQLIAYTANSIFAQDIIPCLHVTETNTGAIKLYEKLGFVTRRKISLWKMKRIS